MVLYLYLIAAGLVLLFVLRLDRVIFPVLVGFDVGMMGGMVGYEEAGWWAYVVAVNGLGLLCMLLAQNQRTRQTQGQQAIEDKQARRDKLHAALGVLDERVGRLDASLDAQKELYQAARSLAYVLTSDMFIHETRTVIEKFFAFRSAWLMRFEPEGEVDVTELHGMETEGLGPFTVAFCDQLRDAKEVAYLCPVGQNGARPVRPESPESCSSYVVMPLLYHEETWGCLVLLDIEPARSLDRASGLDCMEVLSGLQHQFALSLSRVLLYDETERLSRTDSLTGLSKRWYFMQRVQEEVERSQRRGEPISLIMVDIDHFKLFNDSYGHLAGDEAIRQVAQLLHKRVRAGDLACRYGGEEFLLALPSTQKQSAGAVAERLRLGIGGLRFGVQGQERSITVSLGVASFPEDDDQIDEIIQKADRMLYRSKWFGRDRTCVYSGEDDEAPSP